jgi:RimJ/RimL family protein N-acetyltransferase
MYYSVDSSFNEWEIRSLHVDDIEQFDRLAKEVYTILSDEQTLHFIPEKRLKSLSEARQWLRSSVINFYNDRNYIHFIRSKSSKELIGMVDILSPSLIKDHYALSEYPYFIEFYLRSESQGNSLMSEILPPLLNVIRQQDIDQVAAVTDKKNLAARRLLEKTGFVYKAAFDLTKDLFLIY